MRLTPSNWDQLERRSADVQVGSIVDRNVRLVTQKILRTELLSEELLREDSWPVGLLFELFLIVASPIKLGTRVQAAEVGMTADMVPWGVRKERGCSGAPPWRKGLPLFCFLSGKLRPPPPLNVCFLLALLE